MGSAREGEASRRQARLGTALLLVLFAVPIPAVAAGSGPGLRAGAASVALRVPAGTPVAGYGGIGRRLLLPDVLGRHAHAFWFTPHQGALGELRARALVVETDEARLVWVAADLVAVGRDFTARLASRLRDRGLAPTTLLLSASHTHSGPGAFLDSEVMGFVAVDREDAVVREAILASLADAVGRASAARTAARVGTGTTRLADLTTGRLGHAPDPEMTVVKVLAEDGAPVAVLWNFAIHGTMLGARSLQLSGDVMGLASAELERTLGVPALFVNGAEGDVSPARHGLDEARAAGRTLAQAVLDVWNGTTATRRSPLVLTQTRVSLPAPGLPLRNCAGRWLPRGLRLPLDGAFPVDAELRAGRLGDVAWVTVPGELQSKLGEEVKRAAGGGPVLVAGLTNDYLGYFVTPEDYDAITYVTCANLYGPGGGRQIAGAAGALLRSIPGGAP